MHLEPRIGLLLEILASEPGRVWSKRELMDAVWPEVVVTEGSLSVAVSALRRALGDCAAEPRYIETIPRRGYRLKEPIGLNADGPNNTPRYALVLDGSIHPLTPGEHILGRLSSILASPPSAAVSRRHARIVVGANTVTLEDLGSKNGTYLNGRRLEGSALLSPGDRLSLGRLGVTLTLVVLDDVETATEASLAGVGFSEG